MVRQYIVLVLAVTRINQKVEAAICILHLTEKVGFPFRLLQKVTLAIPAFGQAQIVQRAGARKCIGREDKRMNQSRAINRVLAVVTSIMMTAADVQFPLV